MRATLHTVLNPKSFSALRSSPYRPGREQWGIRGATDEGEISENDPKSLTWDGTSYTSTPQSSQQELQIPATATVNHAAQSSADVQAPSNVNGALHSFTNDQDDGAAGSTDVVTGYYS